MQMTACQVEEEEEENNNSLCISLLISLFNVFKEPERQSRHAVGVRTRLMRCRDRDKLAESSGSANRKETMTKIKTTFGSERAASLNNAADCNLSRGACPGISHAVCPHCS